VIQTWCWCFWRSLYNGLDTPDAIHRANKGHTHDLLSWKPLIR
jgi:hypothetical protein